MKRIKFSVGILLEMFPRNNSDMWTDETLLSLAMSGLAVELTVAVWIVLVKKSLLNILMHLLKNAEVLPTAAQQYFYTST